MFAHLLGVPRRGGNNHSALLGCPLRVILPIAPLDAQAVRGWTIYRSDLCRLRSPLGLGPVETPEPLFADWEDSLLFASKTDKGGRLTAEPGAMISVLNVPPFIRSLRRGANRIMRLFSAQSSAKSSGVSLRHPKRLLQARPLSHPSTHPFAILGRP